MSYEIDALRIKLAKLELHNEKLMEALDEAIDFIDAYVDIDEETDEDGRPLPNKAMRLHQKCSAAYQNCDVYDLR
jgi:hypothetical protein